MENKPKKSRAERARIVKLRRLNEQLAIAQRGSKEAPSDKGREIMKDAAIRLEKEIQKLQPNGK